jgi:hypothetical protein
VRSWSSNTPVWRVPDYMSYERIWQHYDLGAGTEHALMMGEFCNQIIHSFNWTIVCHEDGGLGGVFFSSDRRGGRSCTSRISI